MSKRMLVDGAHPEEIRVVVTSGNRLDEYDIETSFKKQVKGNIYLAKVTRVEPSLQAAFVDFGGNRHGFLAFSEIHPDYYQIPVEDRQALIKEQEELELEARVAREHLEDIDGDVGDENDEADADVEIAENATEETDNKEDADLLRLMCYDGRLRSAVPWNEQHIDVFGYHYYMTPHKAKIGLKNFEKVKDVKPMKKDWDYYPDIHKLPVYKKFGYEEFDISTK